MDAASRSELIQAVEKWAENHPRKNEPVLRIFGIARCYSPVEVAKELASDTPTGRLLRQVFANAGAKLSITELVKSFDSASKPQVAKARRSVV